MQWDTHNFPFYSSTRWHIQIIIQNVINRAMHETSWARQCLPSVDLYFVITIWPFNISKDNWMTIFDAIIIPTRAITNLPDIIALKQKGIILGSSYFWHSGNFNFTIIILHLMCAAWIHVCYHFNKDEWQFQNEQSMVVWRVEFYNFCYLL